MELTSILLLPFKLLFWIISSKAFLWFFSIYSLLSIYLLHHIKKATEKYRVIKPGQEKFHEQYNAFRRLDGKYWNFFQLYLGAIFLSWIRIVLFILSTILCWFCCKVVCGFKEPVDLSLQQRHRLSQIGCITGTFHMWIFGIRWTTKDVDFDYSPYLGTDYNKENDSSKAISHICNHIGWVDIFTFMSQEGAGFIARAEVKNYYLIGYIAKCIGTLFVDRHDKNDRNSALNLVIERQKEKAEGRSNTNLLIFPEGSSSNATALLEFKRGPFINKNYSVKPYIILLDQNTISLAMDVIEMGYHFFIVICKPCHHFDLVSMPVFHPNDWMYQNSQFKGKDDWKVYADCVRDAMSKASGLPKSRAVYEEKVTYLKILREGLKIPSNDEL